MSKRFLAYLVFLLFSLAYPASSFSPTHFSATRFNHAVRVTEAANTALRTQAFESYLLNLYTDAGLKKTNLDYTVFRKALIGYYNLLAKPSHPVKSIISVIDFSKSSRQKRLWVIDLKNKKLLFNTLVAHGRGTGSEFAKVFSNEPNSFKSSLGFYLTSHTYYGKHGLSLKLNGLDKNFNSNANSRAVVLHGADYVSENFIKQYGRLGRSLGCPALPVEVTPTIIKHIKDNTCLYIYAPDKTYTSDFLKEATAIDSFATQFMPAQPI
jgi:hypothetical protein